MNSTLNSKHQRQRSGFRQVDPVIAEAMKAVVSEHVNERRSAQLGLSYNIWCKIRSGQPIRSSLAERLELRVQKIFDGPVASSDIHSANTNEFVAADCVHRGLLDEQARFEACVARELYGDLDF
ncbi:MAG: hypothetical protein IPG54_14005 [Sphingomonadales bacterium]|jgi:hypothetical protein|nr:hypothetical protein [Sphingomonadales bacterium]MBK9005053.1 hypothetical protein [Sphingomonadales bacterium]MBK9267213.1 hypothetical protein [Sphingomonadales bacterium]